jgi:hypothetical protein
VVSEFIDGAASVLVKDISGVHDHYRELQHSSDLVQELFD